MALKDLKPYQFKPGQSGNPKGRPKNRVKLEWLPRCLGKERARAIKVLTGEEIEAWEKCLLVATTRELQEIVKWDDAPSFAKNIAISILYDTKAGRTSTIDKIRERYYGKEAHRIELTGANGAPLNPAPLAVEIIDSRDKVEAEEDEK